MVNLCRRDTSVVAAKPFEVLRAAVEVGSSGAVGVLRQDMVCSVLETESLLDVRALLVQVHPTE